MSSYILFLLLGLGSGAVYAVLGLGLVLKYRSAGVVDFGHGAVAMFCAYVFVELRDSGELQFPWIIIPHQLKIGPATGMGAVLSVVITLVYAAVLGLIFYLAIYRPLRAAPALARVGASIGVLLALQTIALLNYSTFAVTSPPILPDSTIHIAGLFVPSDQLYLAGLTVVLGLVLAAVYRFTRFGRVTRAAVENERGAALLGHSASRIAAYNWVIATVLAAAAGILILPISTLNPGTYTLFIVPALGAALLGRFSSFGAVVAGGLGIGMIQSLTVKLQSVWHWLPQTGLQDGLPFIIIMLTIIVLARRLSARGAISDVKNPVVGRPTRPALTAGGSVVVGIVALLVLSSQYRAALDSSLITACICFSVVIITGYVGQISLAQNSMAGVSAFMLTHIASSLGIGFPFGLILAALCAVVLGVAVGLPAVRVRGVNLAVATLAVATALDALLFNNTSFSGGYTGRNVGAPHLLGLNLGPVGSGQDTQRLAFGILVVVLVAAVGLFTARLRLGRLGRSFLAVRSNERAAASVGIDVARTKLFAFGIAAFVAGIGGGLLAYQQQNVNAATFTTFTSLTILAITYVGGIGRITGAIAAGALLSANGLVPTLLNNLFSFGQYQMLIAGVLLTVTAVANPDGMTKEMGAGLTKLRRATVARVGGGDTPATPGASSPPPGVPASPPSPSAPASTPSAPSPSAPASTPSAPSPTPASTPSAPSPSAPASTPAHPISSQAPPPPAVVSPKVVS